MLYSFRIENEVIDRHILPLRYCDEKRLAGLCVYDLAHIGLFWANNGPVWARKLTVISL